jgi:predicted amidohydrolase
MKSRRIRVAVVQMNAEPAPVSDRLRRARELIAQAAQSGAQLVVLPELFNTGYSYRDENFDLAETANGQTAHWMEQLSAGLSVHLAGSLLLRDAEDIYNALLLYAPDGRVWRYDKNYPWGWERAYFRERRAITIAETELGAIGLMLCWDMAHARLWRDYAGKIDLMLACSCPPEITNPIYHFPDNSQVTLAQMGRVYASMRNSTGRVFVDTPAQQATWLGVPFIGSSACGSIRTSIPNPVGSFLVLLLTAPWLIRHLHHIRQVELSVPLVEATRVIAADGQPLAGLRNEQGETFTLAQIEIPIERSQPHSPQPRPPVPRLAYLVSDRLLPSLSLETYARRYKRRG